MLALVFDQRLNLVSMLARMLFWMLVLVFVFLWALVCLEVTGSGVHMLRFM